MKNVPIYVIEIRSSGDSDIRRLTEVERVLLETKELEKFTLWRCDGSRRFWAYWHSEKEINSHGFSMKDQYSKDHGYHTTDFVALGNGIYEYYEEGFDQADALIRQFGSFNYFFPEYSWGSNGCELLLPNSDIEYLITSHFVNLITRKDLIALAVTADVSEFLYGYLEKAGGVGGEDVKTKAIRMGLLAAYPYPSVSR